jgi:outer membrane protein TolC
VSRKRWGAVLVLALALTPVIATAPAARAATPAGERELTLEDALALAKKRNKSLFAERARVAQVQTNLDSAWARLLPTVAAQGRYTRNYAEFQFALPAGSLLVQPINQLDAVISFNAPLIVPAAYPGLKAVKANIAAAEANFEMSETQVLFGVAQAFYAAAIADEVLVARRSSIEVTRATLKNAQTRFSAGTVTKVDVDRAELAVLRAEQMERESRHAREQAYRGLGTLIQVDGPFRVKTPSPLVVSPPPEDLEMALKLRPEFRSLELSARAADLQASTDAWRWSPQISAFGNARRFNYDNFNRDRYSWAIGVQLDWVLYDGGARDAERHQANAQEEESQARAEVLRDSIRDDLANGKSLVETKLQAVGAATRSVELARETIELVRTQYEAGAVTQVDLLQAQDGLVGAQEALAQARFDLAVADLTLRRTAGTFPPK